AAARGSEKLHAWLLGHQRFGPMIRDWQAEGAVSRRAKWLATAMMALAAAVMFLTAPKWWMAATGTAIMAVVDLWLWRRPEPRRQRRPHAAALHPRARPSRGPCCPAAPQPRPWHRPPAATRARWPRRRA